MAADLPEEMQRKLGDVNCHSFSVVKDYYIKQSRIELARNVGVIKAHVGAKPMKSAYRPVYGEGMSRDDKARANEEDTQRLDGPSNFEEIQGQVTGEPRPDSEDQLDFVEGETVEESECSGDDSDDSGGDINSEDSADNQISNSEEGRLSNELSVVIYPGFV